MLCCGDVGGDVDGDGDGGWWRDGPNCTKVRTVPGTV